MSLHAAAARTPVPPGEPRRRLRGPTGARPTRHVYNPAHADPRVLILLGHNPESESASDSDSGSQRPQQRRPRRPTTAPARGAEREELERQKALVTSKKSAKLRWRGTIRTAMLTRGGFVAPGLGAGSAPASTGPLSNVRVATRTMRKVHQMILATKQVEAEGAAARTSAAEALQGDKDGEDATAGEKTGSSTTQPRRLYGSSHEPPHKPSAAWTYAKKMTIKNAATVSVQALTRGILQEDLKASQALEILANSDEEVSVDQTVALHQVMARRVQEMRQKHGCIAKRLEGAISGGRLGKTDWWEEVVGAQSNSPALFDIRDYRTQKFKGRMYASARHERVANCRNGKLSSQRNTARRQPLTGGDYELVSTEHTTMSLRKRLTSGDTTDSKAVEEARKHVPTFDHSTDPAAMQKVRDTIVALNGLAHSSYTEIQRGAAAAFNSLSIAEDSKPVFLESDALRTVVHLAKSPDIEILNNIVEAVGRLCQHPLIKRPFVAAGVLKVLHKFSTASNAMAEHALFALMGLCHHDPNRPDRLKYAHLKPNADDKLRITTAESGHFVQFIFKCTRASTGANERPDPKSRRHAIATITSLLDGPENMVAMLRGGALDHFIKLLRSRDSHMRLGAATALTSLMRLSPTANVPQTIYEQLRQDICLQAVFAALADAVEIDLLTALLNLVQAAVTHASDGVSKSKLRKRMIRLGCADVLMRHAVRLLATADAPVQKLHLSSAKSISDKQASKLILLRKVTATLVVLLQGQTVLQAFVRLEEDHLQSVMKIIEAKDKRTCRHGTRLLGRLSTLPEAKQRLLENSSNLPQLLSLATGELLIDASPTIARILAELAEAWQNRVPLINGGVLTGLQALLTTAWEISTKFNCARCLADLAEAVDNREAIATSCLPLLASLLRLEHAGVREQTFRCILNLVAVAGRVATILPDTEPCDERLASPSLSLTAGRYGLTIGVEYGMVSDGEEEDEEDEEEYVEENDEMEQDTERGGKGYESVELGNCSQSSEGCVASWRRAIGAVAPQTFASLNDVAWWATDEGKSLATTHNEVARAQIHWHLLSNKQMLGHMMALMRNKHLGLAKHATRVVQQLTQTEAEATVQARLKSDFEQSAKLLVTRRQHEGRSVGFRR